MSEPGKEKMAGSLKLSPLEKRVLTILADEGYEGFCYWGFAGLIANTQLDRKQVRRACRSLARKGYARFGRGLWTKDGEPAGSGYCATKAGADALAELTQ